MYACIVHVCIVYLMRVPAIRSGRTDGGILQIRCNVIKNEINIGMRVRMKMKMAR